MVMCVSRGYMSFCSVFWLRGGAHVVGCSRAFVGISHRVEAFVFRCAACGWRLRGINTPRIFSLSHSNYLSSLFTKKVELVFHGAFSALGVSKSTPEDYHVLLSLANAIIMHIYLAFNPITSSSSPFRVSYQANVPSQSSSHVDVRVRFSKRTCVHVMDILETWSWRVLLFVAVRTCGGGQEHELKPFDFW